MIRRDLSDIFDTEDEESILCQSCEANEDDVQEASRLPRVAEVDDSTGRLAFNQKALQRYILNCSQHMSGGLRDKPSKARDYYHSCYALSGLSVSQW